MRAVLTAFTLVVATAGAAHAARNGGRDVAEARAYLEALSDFDAVRSGYHLSGAAPMPGTAAARRAERRVPAARAVKASPKAVAKTARLAAAEVRSH